MRWHIDLADMAADAYHGPMVRWAVGAVSIGLGALLAYWGLRFAITMARLSFRSGGGWLGPEPEMLIPVAFLLVAALLGWLGVHLWRQMGP